MKQSNAYSYVNICEEDEFRDVWVTLLKTVGKSAMAGNIYIFASPSTILIPEEILKEEFSKKWISEYKKKYNFWEKHKFNSF